MFCWIVLLLVVVVSTENGLVYHQLGEDGVKFAYEIDSTQSGAFLVKLHFHIQSPYRWLIAGLQNSLEDEDVDDYLLTGTVKRDGQMRRFLKACRADEEKGIKLSSTNNLYSWEGSDIADDGFVLVISRPLTGIDYEKAISFIWAAGKEENLTKIPHLFAGRRHNATLTLVDENSFKINTADEDIPTKTTRVPTTTTTEEVIPSTEENLPDNNKALDREEESTNKPDESESPSIPSIKVDIPATETVNTIHGVHLTTPCPAPVCNCSTESSSWMNVLREKQNTVYFAVIGAAALCTGLIVLGIACCCARNSAKPPRKHKVSFYKVDNFQSDDEEADEMAEDDDEEIQFLKEKS